MELLDDLGADFDLDDYWQDEKPDSAAARGVHECTPREVPIGGARRVAPQQMRTR